MKKVIIESPYAGNIALNTEYARLCVKDSLMRGEAPIASHLLYTQPEILDDNNVQQRVQGIEAGLLWGKTADITAMYCDLSISHGMEQGATRAAVEGRTIEHRFLFSEGIGNHIKEINTKLANAKFKLNEISNCIDEILTNRRPGQIEEIRGCNINIKQISRGL